MSDDVRLGLVLGGAVLVLAALLWRYLHRRGQTHALLRQMEDTDPQVRARAGISLIDLGLSRASRPLLAHVATEPDDRVKLAVALAVGRRQWEPSNTKRVRQVREWAALELERQGQPMTAFGPAMTRLSDMGGPRPPDQQSASVDTASNGPPVAPPVAAADPLETISWDTQAANTRETSTP
jgi:HEAT repeats